MDVSIEFKKKRSEESSSKPGVTLGSEDRLSRLPEEVRRHIVSLLPVTDAIRTTTLARLWSRICYSLPNLIFEFKQFPNVEGKLDRFVAFIDQMISRYEGSSIKTFHLEFCVNNESYTHFNNEWVTFAVERNVENITILVQIAETQKLPSCLFTAKSLKKLELLVVGYVLKLTSAIDLPNLKELTLIALRLTGDSQTLFSSCPALETLSIESCDVSRLEIFAVSSLSLKVFRIYGCHLDHQKIIAVSAPNLKHLEICKSFHLRKCEINLQTPNLEIFSYDADMAQDINLGNISSIHDVILCVHDHHPESRHDYSICAAKVLTGLCNTTTLLLSESFVEYLFSGSGDPLKHLNRTSFNCLKYVTIYMRPAKQHVQKTIALTRILNPHSLWIVIADGEQPPNVSYLETNSEDLGLGEILSRLEFVEIENFKGSESELEIVEFLLNNAKFLTEMRILEPPVRSDQTGLSVGTNDEIRTAFKNTIMAFKRASSEAKISILQCTHGS